MKYLSILYILIALCCWQYTWAYSPQITDDYILITTKAGLSNNKVTCILQDNTGYIWIGTEDGLNRFDGYNIVQYKNTKDNPASVTGNSISHLFLDSKNNLWVGTKYSGLSRYNRELDNFTNFSFNSSDYSSLAHNSITDIEESDNILWVSTLFGLNLLSLEDYSNRRFYTDITFQITDEIIAKFKTLNISDDLIKELQQFDQIQFRNSFELEDTLENSIKSPDYDKHKNTILAWGPIRFSNSSKSDESISAIEIGKNSNIWLAHSQGGISLFNYKTSKKEYYKSPFSKKGKSTGNDFSALKIVDSTLYCGGFWGWVDKMNINTKQWERVFELDEFTITGFPQLNSDTLDFLAGGKWFQRDLIHNTLIDSRSIFHQQLSDRLHELHPNEIYINALLKDNQSNMWIGTNNGLILLEKHKAFSIKTNNPEIENSLTSNNISALHIDSKGRTWVGYHNSHINVFSPNGKLIHHFHGKSTKNMLGGGTVFSFKESKEGRIYVGTYSGGIQYHDEANNIFKTIQLHPDDINYQNNHDVRSIEIDNEGTVWAVLHGGGVSKIVGDTLTRRIKADYNQWKFNLHHDWLTSSEIDGFGNIWFGSFEGLSMYNPKTDSFISFKSNEPEVGLPSNIINDIYLDKTNKLWFATNSGLCSFNYSDSTFTTIQDIQNSNIQAILAIEEDSFNNLWFSTNSEIVKYNTTSNSFDYYSTRDGIRNIQPKVAVSTKNKKGEIYFGGVNGYIRFKPENIKDNNYLPKVIINNIKLFHKNVPITPNQPKAVLSKQLSFTDKITLEYSSKIITLEFLALNYIQTEKNQFKYKLEGFDEKWNEVGNKREAHYTNLPPDTYTFTVIASNNDNHWNTEGKSLIIVVKPAWWMTWWFRTLIAASILLFFFAYLRYRLHSVKRINTLLETKVKKRTAELQHANEELQLSHNQIHDQHIILKEKHVEIENQKNALTHANLELEKSNSTKSKMLSIIAHDLKNPMSAVMGFSDILARNAKEYDFERINKFAQTINNASVKTFNLLENLLTWARSQTNNISIDLQYYSSTFIVKKTIEVLQDTADKKDISIQLKQEKEYQIMVDLNTTSTIIRNLLSNAIKFSPRGSSITITVEKNEMHVKFKVIDCGVGMTDKQIDKLFTITNNNSTNGTEKESGTGLGLIICKEFAELNNAFLKVSSTLGEGSCFELVIPNQ